MEFRNNRDVIHRNQESHCVKYIINTKKQYISIELQYFSVKENAVKNGLGYVSIVGILT